jgi:hypothetical protein
MDPMLLQLAKHKGSVIPGVEVAKRITICVIIYIEGVDLIPLD